MLQLKKGDKFGDWVVLERSENDNFYRTRWLCECVCGVVRSVLGYTLVNGSSKSCGHVRNLDLIGKRFYKLTVIKKAEDAKNPRRPRWECLCDCGGKKIVFESDLIRGSIKSCGCVKGSTLPYGGAAFNIHHKNYVRRAEKRGLVFNLTKQLFKELCDSNCYYCGSSPSLIVGGNRKGCNGVYMANGVDRIDNAEGYTPKNCVPCCATCNKAKNAMTPEEWISWLLRISFNFIESGKYKRLTESLLNGKAPGC